MIYLKQKSSIMKSQGRLWIISEKLSGKEGDSLTRTEG